MDTTNCRLQDQIHWIVLCFYIHYTSRTKVNRHCSSQQKNSGFDMLYECKSHLTLMFRPWEVASSPCIFRTRHIIHRVKNGTRKCCLWNYSQTESPWAPHIQGWKGGGNQSSPNREAFNPWAMTLSLAPLTLSTDTDTPLKCRSGYEEPNQPLSCALRDTVVSLTRDRHEILLCLNSGP